MKATYRSTPSGLLVDRGVYTERCLSAAGNPMMVAVASNAREVARREVLAHERAADVAAELRRVLNEADPVAAEAVEVVQ